MARLLLLAFRGAGSFGGAAYTPGPDADSREWLLNPFVRETPVERPYLSDPTTDSDHKTDRKSVTYGSYWTLNVVLDGYVSQLLAAAERDITTSAQCTLCHSADHACGPTGCAFESLVDRLEVDRGSVVAALQAQR
jgi:hypothetical protein